MNAAVTVGIDKSGGGSLASASNCLS
ncbi:hypothetical protein A2U01_0091404, partial [Trifolium medium]|nr:hypothetical protein [Trifolium medium]